MIPSLQSLAEPPSLYTTTEGGAVAAMAAPGVAIGTTAMMDASLNDRATKRQRSGGKGGNALLLDDSSTHTVSTSASTQSSSSFTTTTTASTGCSTTDGTIASLTPGDDANVNNHKKRHGTGPTTTPTADTTPVTTTVVSGGRRGVTFSPVTNIHSNKWTREEVDQGWYTKEELAIFKMERKALVKTLKKVKFDLSKIDQSVHCLRGYEAYFSLQANKEYKLKRQMVWEAVLREQQRQRYCGLQDTLMMHLVSSHATQWARDTALNLGMADAQVALQIFLEYIQEQQEDDFDDDFDDDDDDLLDDYDDCDYDDTPIAIDWSQPEEDFDQQGQQQQPILFDMEEQGEEEEEQQPQGEVLENDNHNNNNASRQLPPPTGAIADPAGGFKDYRDDSTSTASSTSCSSMELPELEPPMELPELEPLSLPSSSQPQPQESFQGLHDSFHNSSSSNNKWKYHNSSSSFPGALVFNNNSSHHSTRSLQHEQMLHSSFSSLPQSLLEHAFRPSGNALAGAVGSNGSGFAQRRNSAAARAS